MTATQSAWWVQIGDVDPGATILFGVYGNSDVPARSLWGFQWNAGGNDRNFDLPPDVADAKSVYLHAAMTPVGSNGNFRLFHGSDPLQDWTFDNEEDHTVAVRTTNPFPDPENPFKLQLSQQQSEPFGAWVGDASGWPGLAGKIITDVHNITPNIDFTLFHDGVDSQYLGRAGSGHDHTSAFNGQTIELPWRALINKINVPDNYGYIEISWQ